VDVCKSELAELEAWLRLPISQTKSVLASAPQSSLLRSPEKLPDPTPVPFLHSSCVPEGSFK